MSDELVERLTGKRAMNGAELRQSADRIQSLTQQVETLTAERDALREALVQISHAYHAMHISQGADPNLSVALTKARAALKETNDAT